MTLVIDPSLEKQAKSLAPQQQINLQKNLSFFQACDENRELIKSIDVVIPVRPEDGMNCDLSRKLAIWYGEGISWSQVNDNCGGFIELTRANMAYEFVNKVRPDGTKPEYLLMIDNDMEPVLDLPIYLVRHKKPIVAGVAVHMHPEVGPRACFTVPSADGGLRWPQLRRHKLPSKGLIKVGHVGTGAMMIHRSVLEAFTFKDGDVPFYVPEKIRNAGASIGRLTMGEDLAFCEQAQAKGFDCFVDMEAMCGHRKTMAMLWPSEATDPNLDAATFALPDADGGIVGT